MRYLIISFLILVLSVFIGVEIGRAHSYILITYNHWVIETSLWVALCVLFLFFIVLYFLLRVLARTFGFGKQYRHWRRLRQYRKARALTHRGLCELTEGYWHKAEELLLKSAKLTPNPLIDYLGAAQAAQAQHAYDRRDNYLRRAHSANKESAVAIGLTQAKLQIEAQQWEQALSTLQNLYQAEPNHGYILKLLTKVYVELREWGKCQELLPKLRKHRVLLDKELEHLEHQVYLALLPQLTNNDPNTLNHFWKSIPKTLRQDPKLVSAYILALLKLRQDEKACDVLDIYLKHCWNADVLKLYSEIRPENPLKLLSNVEHWLKRHPQDGVLLMILGTLSMRQSLWGKAKDYFSRSAEINPTRDIFFALGELHLELHDSEAAQNYFKQSIKCSTGCITR